MKEKIKIRKIFNYLITTIVTLNISMISFASDSNSCNHLEKNQVNSIKWLNSLEDGIKRAKAEKKYLLVDFCADWCGACHELDQKTYTNNDVICVLNQDFITTKIDISKIPNAQEIISRFGINELPAILFFDKEAKLIPDKRLIGFTQAGDFLKALEQIRKI